MEELVVPQRKIESTNEIFFCFVFLFKNSQIQEKKKRKTWDSSRGSLKKRGLIKWKANSMILWRTFMVLAYIPWKENSETSNKSGVELRKHQKLWS
jgi:hypothetical protein